MCPPRAGVDTRPAWPGVDCAARHRVCPYALGKSVAVAAFKKGRHRVCPYALRNLDG